MSKIIISFLIGLASLFGYHQSFGSIPITQITNGGTATSTFPAYGKVLVGGKSNEYEFVATSTFGNTYTSTYPITLTGSAFGLLDFGTTTSNTFTGTQTFNNITVNGTCTGCSGASSSHSYSIASTSSINAVNGFATSTSITIPAGTLTASSTIQISTTETCNSTSYIYHCDIYIRDGNSNNFVYYRIPEANGISYLNSFDASIFSSGNSLSSQTIIGKEMSNPGGTPFLYSYTGTSAINFANALELQIVIWSENVNATTTLNNFSIIVNP